ncbi:probable peroxisomal membrane protein PEX13 [Diabrotica virgifera virgifera]|uniref:Prisilkin-39-like n=1 Tax=Diabrotica virgifera virgifera TaxID=50390 RepID=A0ABM5I910_DIAVI|nr:probable peroxisomal membrane protein PEX13 [Diabrotica virgifera virgifera]
MANKCLYLILFLCSLGYLQETTCEADPQLGLGNLLGYGRRPDYPGNFGYGSNSGYNFPGNGGYGSNIGYNQYRRPSRYPFGGQYQPGYGYGSGRGFGYGNRPGDRFPSSSGGGVLFGYAYRGGSNYPNGNIFSRPNYGKK